jgi:hypothetical protein
MPQIANIKSNKTRWLNRCQISAISQDHSHPHRDTKKIISKHVPVYSEWFDLVGLHQLIVLGEEIAAKLDSLGARCRNSLPIGGLPQKA